MKNHLVAAFAGLATGLMVTTAPAEDARPLVLENFREPHGDWQPADDAKLQPDDEKLLAGVGEGPGTILNGPTGKTGNLITLEEYGDVHLTVDFLVARGSNSGVYLMGRYEVQVYDSHGKEDPQHSDAGGIYQRWKDEMGYEGRSPLVNAAKPAGEWQTFDIIFRAPRFNEAGEKTANAVFELVKFNGQLVHENAELTGPTRASTWGDEKPTGPIMFQGDHGPVAFRNLRVRPLEPAQ